MKRTAPYHLILSLKCGQRSLFLHSVLWDKAAKRTNLSLQLKQKAFPSCPFQDATYQHWKVGSHTQNDLSFWTQVPPNNGQVCAKLAIKDIKCLQSGKKMGFVILGFGVLDEFKELEKSFFRFSGRNFGFGGKVWVWALLMTLTMYFVLNDLKVRATSTFMLLLWTVASN